MRVDTDELVHFGTQRYEDAVDIWATYKLLGDTGAVAPRAWGHLRWSDEWRRSWDKAIEWRREDAVAARRVMFQTSYALLQLAADYSGTDIKAATSFDNLDEDVRGYHSRGPGNYTIGTFRPGGTPSPPDAAAGPTGIYRRPEVLENESSAPPLWRDEQYGDYHGWNPASENDTLEDFIADNGETLKKIGSVYISETGKEWAALTDKLEPAHAALPTVIYNRADLIHSCARAYDFVYDRIAKDVDRISDRWTDSVGGHAFLTHANTLKDYVADCRDLCATLATDGTKIAKVLSAIRTAYASAGYSRIRDLIARWEDYEETTASWVGGVTEFFTNGTTEQLVKTADGFTDAMTAKASGEYAWAESLILAEDRARGAPDLDNKQNKHRPFPEEDPYSGWDTPGEWTTSR